MGEKLRFMEKLARFAVKPLLIIFFVCALLMSSSFVFAKDGGTITASFSTFGHTVDWDYAYSADYFSRPQDEYNHDLARLSLGMALSAFRSEEDPQHQDKDIIAFFQSLGFDRIETDSYRNQPTSYSISYGFAQLKTGNSTVLALAVCGGNYGAEWTSNLTVGDENRPVGFQDAATKVQAALKDYMERNPIKGDVKLWIAGYSRGGAVANITAADCTDSGLFKAVYAYTFATPRTTRTPGNYTNIFNILQKNDVVPKIPLADWGFKRYGRDMYLVSPEIDMDRMAVVDSARDLYRQMIGSEMMMNFELNYHLRILCDYLLLLMPDSAAYTQYLQPLILDIMTSSEDTTNALDVLLRALQKYGENDTQHGEELKAMRDYIGTLLNTYVLQDGLNQLPASEWDPEFGAYNFFNDHFPFEYIAMMFSSDDPDQVFSNNTRYVRIVIYGKVDVRILDGTQVIKTVLANGTELVNGVESPSSMPDVVYSKNKVVITLPADRSYNISVQSKSVFPQTITYTGLIFSGDTVMAQSDDLYSYLMTYRQSATIRTSSNGKAIEPEGSDFTDVSLYVESIYSPTTAMKLEHNNVIHLTISGLVNRILIILAVMILQAVASLVLTIIRIVRHRKRKPVVALIWHCAVASMFIVLELSLWYFVPVLTLAKFIPAILVYLVLVIYAIKGYRTNRRNLKVFFILVGALTAYLILESLLAGDFAIWKAILLTGAYVAFIVLAFKYLWAGASGNDKQEDVPMDDGNTIRLLKKKRKGIFGLIFSRVGLVALLIVIEVLLLLAVYQSLNYYFKWITLAQSIFSVIMVFYLFNCSMDATAKLTWMFIIMLIPIPGTILLWLTQKNVGHKMVKERVEKMISETKDALYQEKKVITDKDIVESGTSELCDYVNRTGCFPIYDNTEVTFFPLGELKYKALLEELRKAEHFIFLEYFIIDEGLMWGSILKILADKAAQGLDVRVMYDGMCEISTLSADYPKRMDKLGIKCKPFSPIQPFISTHYNYRDHRKIMVIDGKVAFNGGVNLADEYINHIERFGHWKDTAVMLRGDAVQSFTLMFLQMWNLTEKTYGWDQTKIRVPATSDGFVMPYCDCPLDSSKVGESVYMDILYRAKKYVHIMTPYLILDNELETALKYAAERGIDVTMILPGIPDKKGAYSLAKSHYKSLLESGVKIYEYTPGFVHAKVFVSDDVKAVVGTINLDYRSLYHHFECATYMYKTSCIKDIKIDFEDTLSKCSKVTPETIKNEKFSMKLRGAIMKLIAPLL